MNFQYSSLKTVVVASILCSLVACSSNEEQVVHDGHYYSTRLPDQLYTIAQLSESQQEWDGAPYKLGGTTKSGVDCSGFVQTTFANKFSIYLPRTTKEQVKQGTRVSKRDIQTGDLVFFKTGRGPNGYHVGIYVKSGQFLHASTRGGVIYSSMNSPYWKRTFWQARRL